MLIHCHPGHNSVLVLPENLHEIEAGQFVTIVRNGKPISTPRHVLPSQADTVKAAGPGDVVRGVAGNSSLRPGQFGVEVDLTQFNPSIEVFYEGKFETTMFDASKSYSLLQPLFVSPEGLIVPEGPQSAMVGILTRTPHNGKIAFCFERGAVVPYHEGPYPGKLSVTID